MEPPNTVALPLHQLPSQEMINNIAVEKRKLTSLFPEEVKRKEQLDNKSNTTFSHILAKLKPKLAKISDYADLDDVKDQKSSFQLPQRHRVLKDLKLKRFNKNESLGGLK